MISEIDKSSVVDETESAKVTTESQMAVFHRVDAATGNDRRPMEFHPVRRDVQLM